MKLSTAKRDPLYINDLPHCTMARNPYYVKFPHCTMARTPASPVDDRAVQKMTTLAPLPPARCIGGGRSKFFRNPLEDIT